MRPLLLIAALLLATASQAQTPEPEKLPTVKTELKRDGSALPYAQINNVITKLNRYGEGLFRMDFKVDTDKTKKPLADIRLAVRSDDADYPIKIDGEGGFALPILPEAEAKTADLATNTGKGDLSVNGSLELNVTPEQLTMAKVRQLVRVARTLREEMLPWTVRWLFPRIEGVRVCSATPTWELEWRENEQLLGLRLPVTSGERDPKERKSAQPRPCTTLTGQESWPDAARLLPPPNSRVSVKLQGS